MSESPVTTAGAPDDAVYRRRSYEPLVGHTFELDHPNGTRISAELVEAEELPGPGECFSLVFRLPQGAPLVQDTYGIGHPVLGQLSLFLVPVGPCRLQAVVNRLEG
jgi:hypothetical protein